MFNCQMFGIEFCSIELLYSSANKRDLRRYSTSWESAHTTAFQTSYHKRGCFGVTYVVWWALWFAVVQIICEFSPTIHLTGRWHTHAELSD